jgi:hypothetical protein
MGLAQVDAGKSLSAFPGDQVPNSAVIVRFKGPFDYTYIYRGIKRWFEQRRFRFYDKRFKDSGKRIKHDLEASRELDEFFAEEYTIKMESWSLTSQEIVVDGATRKVHNGMIQFTIKGKIITDRASFFKGHESKFIRWLGYLIMNIRWREIEMAYIDVMEYRTQDIQTHIKELLDMTLKENAPW